MLPAKPLERWRAYSKMISRTIRDCISNATQTVADYEAVFSWSPPDINQNHFLHLRYCPALPMCSLYLFIMSITVSVVIDFSIKPTIFFCGIHGCIFNAEGIVTGFKVINKEKNYFWRAVQLNGNILLYKLCFSWFSARFTWNWFDCREILENFAFWRTSDGTNFNTFSKSIDFGFLQSSICSGGLRRGPRDFKELQIS